MTKFLNATPPANSAKSLKSQIAYSIYDGRYEADHPRTSVAPPVQLFHPVFGHFLDDVKSGGPVPDETTRLTWDYMKSASAVYASEEERRWELTPLLCGVLGVRLNIHSMILNENPDGITELITNPGPILLLLSKNELGEGGFHPLTQIDFSVASCWAKSRVNDSH